MTHDILLSATQLTKRFGGLAAVNAVSLDLWRSRIHAVIGPNGAGKSTLTHLLSGDLPPTEGRVTLAGQDVTGWSPEKISRQGLGRSYQKTNIFAPFSVWDNVHLAAQSRAQHPARPRTRGRTAATTYFLLSVLRDQPGARRRVRLPWQLAAPRVSAARAAPRWPRHRAGSSPR